jgi:hemolysin activation/secretion protein
VNLTLKWIRLTGSSIAILTSLAVSATAQSTPPAGVTIPPDAPETIEQTIPTPSDIAPVPPPEPLPATPEPNLQTPPPTEVPEVTAPVSISFSIQQVNVIDNTVLHDEIAKLVKGFLKFHTEATFEDLVELRSQITQLYITNGYITSGAFVPNNQDLGDGVVDIQVVEGELERIEISGLHRLRAGYVRDRLKLAASRPLNQNRLEQSLQLLQLDPLIAQVNAELTAGSAPGRNVLRVALRESNAFHAGVGGDNYQSPSIGSQQFNIQVSHDNVFGFGDRLSTGYGFTEGLDSFDVSYAIPLNPRDGTLRLGYNNDDSIITEEEFEELEIRSESETFSISFRQPLSKTPEHEFALGLGLDWRRSQTFILDDIPFSFSEGPEDGESRVSVLRFFQDWVDRDARRVLAARSQFSFGLDTFDATVNDSGTDGRFFSWIGQFQYVQQLSPRLLLLTQLSAQLSPDSLLPLERFSLGGVDTVRGYTQNQLVADNGILGAVELRIPLTSDPTELQLTPFFEIGHAWNNRTTDPDPDIIAGLGLGVRWLITPGLTVRLDYGAPLVDVDNEGNSLQEDGLYFSLRYQPF